MEGSALTRNDGEMLPSLLDEFFTPINFWDNGRNRRSWSE